MTEYERSAPFHSKPVPLIDINRLIELAVGHEHEERLHYLLGFLSDPNRFPYEEPTKHVISDVDQRDIFKMLTNKVIAKLPSRRFVKRWARFFTVYERRKHRRRGILWPEQVNDEQDYDCLVELASLLQQMSEVLPGDWAVIFDLAISFHQLGFSRGPNGVSKNFCFETIEGDVYEYLVGVMGWRPMAELMDIITKIMATSRVLVPGDIPVRVRTHVDNVRFLGTRLATAAARDRMRTNAAYINSTLNEEPGNEPHQHGEFCGAVTNYVTAEHSCPPAILEKLQEKYDEFMSDQTFEAASSFFGVLFHVCAILRAPLDEAYHTLKWYRKAMHKATKFGFTGAEHLPFWPSVLPQLDNLMGFIHDNRPIVRPPRDASQSHLRLYTDASDSGWGAVLFPGDGTVRIAAGRWTPMEASRDISERETMAVVNGVQAFGDFLCGSTFELHVDNTSVMWGIAKGYARSFHLNKRITELRSVLAPLGAAFTIHYVRSALNHADAPSRFEDADFTQLASPHGVPEGASYSLNILQPTRKDKGNVWDQGAVSGDVSCLDQHETNASILETLQSVGDWRVCR